MIETCKRNIKKGLKTTGIGIIFIVSGIGLLIDQRHDITEMKLYAFGGLTVIGLLLLIAPDDFLSWAKNKFAK